MKKGLLITLMIVLASMMSVSVYAYAPVLDDLPDIIIGDNEDNLGLSVDQNFFRFTDAFQFDDYVSDQDTTESILKWSFQEVTGTGEILINGLGEEIADLSGLNPTNDLRAAAAGASFRDNLASPSSLTAPYAEPGPLSDVVLALYVSDANFVTSDTIDVVSVDDADDGLSGGIPPFWTIDFSDMTRWALDPAANTAVSEEVGGQIVCKFATTNFGFYFWKKGSLATGIDFDLTYTADTIYVLKSRMSADDNDTVPQVRIRIQSEFNSYIASALYSGAAGQGGVPTTTPGDFYQIYKPQGANEDATVYIDIISGLTTNLGTVYIDQLDVYKVPEAQMVAGAALIDNSDLGPSGLNILPDPAASNGVTITGGNAVLTGVDNDWNSAGQFLDITPDPAPGDIYRLTYGVSKSGTGAGYNSYRLRVTDTANVAYNSNILFNPSATTFDLGTTPADYVHYHLNLNAPSVLGDMTLSFDSIDKGDADEASIVWNSFTLEKITFDLNKLQ